MGNMKATLPLPHISRTSNLHNLFSYLLIFHSSLFNSHFTDCQSIEPDKGGLKKMALQAPVGLQPTKSSSPPASPLAPTGNVGLRRPIDRFALRSSFFSSPSLQLFISPNQAQPLAAAPRFSMRVASKQAYICRDCGYSLVFYFIHSLDLYFYSL